MSGADPKNKPAEPLVVADRILWLRKGIDTTPMHVLKIVYLCHGWMLGINGEPLINEPVEAWTYGPVIPTVYHQYKKYGGGPVRAKPFDRREGLNPVMNELINSIESVYRSCTASQLSALTHQPETPWDITVRKSGIGSVIPDDLIEEHYQKLLSE